MLKLHTTQPYTCSYLPGQLACSEIVTPDHPISVQAYGKLIQAGFRRSGHYIYRPCCDHCHACLSVRVPVKNFSPKRTQRRVWKQHANLLPSQHPLHYQASHFTLYQRYQAKRHTGGGMDLDCREQYHNFLLQSHVNSRLIEFHDNHRLCMISIIDLLPDGLSSVYTFFDADTPRASYGTYSILWQIELCRELGLDYLYLGYWIKANRKMRYKTNFQPLEVLIDGCWYPLDYDVL